MTEDADGEPPVQAVVSDPYGDGDGAAQVDVAAERARLIERLNALVGGIVELEYLQETVAQIEKLQHDRLARQPALIKQLTFYFSDANIRRDRFLREKIEADPVGEGFVELAALLPFNRLKVMGCTTATELAAAVDKAPPSANLELNAARTGVRRRGGAPLPATQDVSADGGPSQVERRTVRIQGFLRGDTSVTIEKVEELCTPYGKVAFVRLLRDNAPPEPPMRVAEFLGSVEVEFGSEDGAAAIANAEPAPSWNGEALTVRPLTACLAERRQALKRGLEGQEDDPDAKRARLQEEVTAAVAKMERGCIFRLDDVPETVSWKDIKNAFFVFGHVAYVDHNAVSTLSSQAKSSFVRMRGKAAVEAAVAAIKRNGGCISIKPHSLRPRRHAVQGEDPSVDDDDDDADGDNEEAEVPAAPDVDGAQEAANDVADAQACKAEQAETGDEVAEGVVEADGATGKNAAGEATKEEAVSSDSVRVAVIQLAGEEELSYLHRVATEHQQKKEKGGKKGGKGSKDFKGGKGGKGKKGGKGGKGGKGKKGKDKKGSRDDA